MNDAIHTYINGQFTTLPRTPEVERARQELLQMSEDKYTELVAAGVSANEATGRVITEFGNLDELADDLGIRAEFDGVSAVPPVPIATRADADKALAGGRRGGLLVGGGVLVILLALATVSAMSDQVMTPAVLFPAVAVAVGLFIFGGFSMRPVAPFKNGDVRLEFSDASHFRQLAERSQWMFVTGLVVGVGLLVLAPGVSGILSGLDLDGAKGPGFLVMIGLGVFVLVASANQHGTLQTLAKADRPAASIGAAFGGFGGSPEAEKRTNWRIGLIAPIYWPAIVAVYLGWSFISRDWHITWIIWPIAGIAFAVFVGILRAASQWNGRQAS